MGLFQRFKQGLQKTQSRLVHEFRRVISRSPQLTADSVEELEAALLSADFGMRMTQQIIAAVKQAYETQGTANLDLVHVAQKEVEKTLAGENNGLIRAAEGPTVVSLVGVNGTGKTTTTAKLAHRLAQDNDAVVMAACDTFRAAAIEQLKLWGERLHIPVITGKYGGDPAAVAHDAIASAISKKAGYVLVDTAGRLHTKSNLMQELQKVHRVMKKLIPDAPHEVLLVLDANTGMNALNQAREFHKAIHLTGLVITKLDGTSKGGMVAGIRKELHLPVKFIGLGEQPEDLQPFDPKEYSSALFTTE